MLPDSHVKEFLHQAYVSAVAAQAGFCCHLSTSDYGVDGRITEVQRLETGKFQDTGVQFSVNDQVYLPGA